MSRNSNESFGTGLMNELDVTAALPVDTETGVLERFDNLPGFDNG